MSSYTHAGVSKLHGKIKVRYANGAGRVNVLIRNDHTDIDMIEMHHAMTKEEAIEYLLRIDFDNGNAAIRKVLEDEAKKRGVLPTDDVCEDRLNADVETTS